MTRDWTNLALVAAVLLLVVAAVLAALTLVPAPLFTHVTDPCIEAGIDACASLP